MERFVAILIEHCGGNFPLWLTPEQIIILPISEKYHDYSEKVAQFLKNTIFAARLTIGLKLLEERLEMLRYQNILILLFWEKEKKMKKRFLYESMEEKI